METLINNEYFVLFIAAIISYVLGSIPTGLIVGKLTANIDIRNFGSGNLGGTNATRVLGKKIGFTVAILDILVKGAIPTLVGILLYQNELIPVQGFVLGIFGVTGHVYPLFAKFKGGKGVATSFGTFLVFSPFAFYFPIYFIISGLLFLGIIKATKYVSLASIIAIPTSAIIMIFVDAKNAIEVTFLLYLAFIIVYKHKENIKRLLKGEERKTGQNKERVK